jgi:diguanylate cyclase (GGDEF)-like protein
MATVCYVFLATATVWAVAALVVTEGEPQVWFVAPLSTASLVGLALGPRINDARRLTPWSLMLGGAGAFGYRVLLRPTQLGAAGALPVGLTLVTVVGYALVLLSLLSLLRDHQDRDRGSLTDSWLVAAGAVPPIAVFLVAPAVRQAGQAWFDILAAGILPLLDVVLLQLVTRLTFAMPARMPAMRLLLTSGAMLLVGDLAWALVAAGMLELSVATLDVPYAFSFIAIAGAALHPSMRQLTVPTLRRTGPLRSARLLMVATALCTPAIVVAAGPLDGRLTRAAVAMSIATAALVAAQRARRAVGEHARNEARLAHLATHDTLTALPNRRMVLEHIEAVLAAQPPWHGDRVAVLFVDVDRFKLINDTWGHPVGDELLVAAADRLRDRVPDATMLAHMSGDEFLIVAAGKDQAFATGLAETVLDSFNDPLTLSIGEVVVTVSVGVTVTSITRAGANDDVVRDADIALYRAKAAGRNRYELFDASMHRAVTNRYVLERDLRLAVERREFAVHYQPIVCIHTNEVLGHEALLRWNRPGHGMVEPQAFVPVLEELDLIIDVGRFVLEQAVAQLANWQSSGSDLYVSVNIAARQIHHGRLVGVIGRLLDEAGVPPGKLLLELTESLLIEESPVVRETIDGLTLLGVELAIDDFGTGHSSLRYLTRFPVSAVKVDRSFVHGLDRDADNATIVQAVVGMSHALGMTVIAEGVETLAQRERLLSLGCDAVQGYMDGRPVAGADLSAARSIGSVYSDLEKGTQA